MAARGHLGAFETGRVQQPRNAVAAVVGQPVRMHPPGEQTVDTVCLSGEVHQVQAAAGTSEQSHAAEGVKTTSLAPPGKPDGEVDTRT